MFIVLEGLDGAGKSTQIQKLQEYCSQLGKRVRFIHFPRYDTPVFGFLISKFLRGDFGSIDNVHPFLVATLFAGDRADAASEIREYLNSGDVVIADRYVYSNIAYQCAKLTTEAEKDELRQWILNTEYDHFSIPKPDLNIFLDVPLSFVGAKLSALRAGDDRDYLQGKKDIHEQSIMFQSHVRDEYLKCVAQGTDLKRVDCSTQDGSMADANYIFELLKSLVIKAMSR